MKTSEIILFGAGGIAAAELTGITNLTGSEPDEKDEESEGGIGAELEGLLNLQEDQGEMFAGATERLASVGDEIGRTLSKQQESISERATEARADMGTMQTGFGEAEQAIGGMLREVEDLMEAGGMESANAAESDGIGDRLEAEIERMEAEAGLIETEAEAEIGTLEAQADAQTDILETEWETSNIGSAFRAGDAITDVPSDTADFTSGVIGDSLDFASTTGSTVGSAGSMLWSGEADTTDTFAGGGTGEGGTVEFLDGEGISGKLSGVNPF